MRYIMLGAVIALLLGLGLQAARAVPSASEQQVDVPQVGNPLLTQSQAIQKGIDFCRQIGAPVQHPGAAAYGIGDAQFWQGKKRSRHWQGTWRVNFGGDVDINVVDATGVIAYYYDYKLSRDLSNKPVTASISADDAVRRAGRVLQLSGQPPEELSFASVELVTICSQPTAACRFWEVDWNRTANGVPYHRQGARVLLQPESGALRGLFLQFPTRPVDRPAFTLKPEGAAAKALRRIADYNMQKNLPFDVRGLTLTEIGAELVEPNDAWPGAGEGERSKEVQSAWRCLFTSPTGPRCELWVDARTGQIHGGDLGLPGGRVSAVREIPRLQDQIQNADEIRVYGSDNLLRWSTKPQGVLSARSHTDILRTLQSNLGRPVIEPLAIPRFKLDLTRNGATAATVWYVPETGLIGAPGHWVSAPTAFRNLIAQLPAAPR